MQHAGKHHRTKQLRIKDLKIREYVDEHGMDVRSVTSKDNVADLLTKPLPMEPFRRHRERFGVRAVGLAALGKSDEWEEEAD